MTKMWYLVVLENADGWISTVYSDHLLERCKAAADTWRSRQDQEVKVLERTPQGYRVAYVSKENKHA